MSTHREAEMDKSVSNNRYLPEGNFGLMMISAYSGRRSQHEAEDVIHMWASIKAIKEQQGNKVQR